MVRFNISMYRVQLKNKVELVMRRTEIAYISLSDCSGDDFPVNLLFTVTLS